MDMYLAREVKASYSSYMYIVEMVCVVKVVNIVGSLYSTMLAPQRVALDLDSEKF